VDLNPALENEAPVNGGPRSDASKFISREGLYRGPDLALVGESPPPACRPPELTHARTFFLRAPKVSRRPCRYD
jgi:hypothetical protein